MDPIESDSRGDLRFSDLAIQTFRPFLEGYDFQVTKQTTTLVDFESPSVLFRVYHGRSSYEVLFEVGLRPRSQEESHLHSLFDVLTVTLEEREARRLSSADQFRASTIDEVRRSLLKLRDLAKEFLVPGLSADKEWWQKLKDAAIESARKYTEASNIRSDKARAKIAWEKKNYQRVVELLDSIADHLTDEEEELLQRARGFLK